MQCVTLIPGDGERLVGETGGDRDDLAPKRDAQMKRFRTLTEDVLGANRVSAILNCLWRMEELDSAAQIPASFALF